MQLVFCLSLKKATVRIVAVTFSVILFLNITLKYINYHVG